MKDYLLLFHTFVVGFVVSEFLAGWREMIRQRKTHTFSTLHLGWSILLFLLLIQNWWGNWPHRDRIAENFLYFLISLCTPIWFYLITVLLFPKDLGVGGPTDYRQYFQAHVRAIHMSVAAMICWFLVSNMVFDNSWDWKAICIRALAVIALIIAIIFNRTRVNAIVLLLCFALLFIYIWTVPWKFTPKRTQSTENQSVGFNLNRD